MDGWGIKIQDVSHPERPDPMMCRRLVGCKALSEELADGVVGGADTGRL
jgi:hypothetical protein